MIDPKVGEIRRFPCDPKRPNATRSFIWAACEVCGKTRWVRLIKGKPKNERCVSCARGRLQGQVGREVNKTLTKAIASGLAVRETIPTPLQPILSEPTAEAVVDAFIASLKKSWEETKCLRGEVVRLKRLLEAADQKIAELEAKHKQSMIPKLKQAIAQCGD